MKIIKNIWNLICTFVKDRIAWWRSRGKDSS